MPVVQHVWISLESSSNNIFVYIDKHTNTCVAWNACECACWLSVSNTHAFKPNVKWSNEIFKTNTSPTIWKLLPQTNTRIFLHSTYHPIRISTTRFFPLILSFHIYLLVVCLCIISRIADAFHTNAYNHIEFWIER